MLELTDTARKELDNYFADKDKTPSASISPRAAVPAPAWPWPWTTPSRRRGHRAHGRLTFLVEKELYAAAKPITVDVTYAGFTVASSLQLAGGGCGCSSGCGTGGAAGSGCGTPGSCCS